MNSEAANARADECTAYEFESVNPGLMYSDSTNPGSTNPDSTNPASMNPGSICSVQLHPVPFSRN